MQNSGYWIYLSFLLLANQNRYANEVLNMPIWWPNTMWVVLVSTTSHISRFITVANTELDICLFLLLANQNRYVNEGIKKYAHWVMTGLPHSCQIWAHLEQFENLTPGCCFTSHDLQRHRQLNDTKYYKPVKKDPIQLPSLLGRLLR